ncbi:MAG: protein BatD [Candidatus Hydrogenedentes bacterium]|nr:protein BatD [Candidatus Hydrogenedentota bacterium]
MMRGILWKTAVFAALLPGLAAWCQQSPVSASLSTNRVGVGEVFLLTLQAAGSDVRNPDVTPVTDTGLVLDAPEVSSASSFTIVNGRSTKSQSRTWRYRGWAEKEGTYRIPPVKISVDGQEYLTQPLTLEVGGPVAGGRQSGARNDGISVEEMAMAETRVDKSEVFQGEAVTLLLRILILDSFNVDLRTPQNLPLPETSGFYTGPQTSRQSKETRGNLSYRVTEISQVLYPTTSGTLAIGGWRWQGQVIWSDGWRPASAIRGFAAPEIAVTVKPLPAPPDGFSGAVGKYRVTAEFPSGILAQGVPAQWVISVTGEGNPDSIGAPSVPPIPWAHLAGPEVETVQDNAAAGNGTKQFRYAVTPLEPGEHELPEVSYVFFAPILKNYKTESIPARKITVAVAAQGSQELVTAGGAREEQRSVVLPVSDDLLPLIEDAGLGARRTGPALALLAALLPLPLYGGLWLWLHRRRRLETDIPYARRQHALKRARGALGRADGQSAEPVQLALAGFVADLVNVNAAGLTASDVADLLGGHGCDLSLVKETTDILRACERARYSGAALPPGDLESLRARAEALLEPLRRALMEGTAP